MCFFNISIKLEQICLEFSKPYLFCLSLKHFAIGPSQKLHLIYFSGLRLKKVIFISIVYGTLYLAKCNENYFISKQVGLKTWIVPKFFLGFCGIVLLIILLFGPMILFSSLNPIA
jgi:hypothetical protein